MMQNSMEILKSSNAILLCRSVESISRMKPGICMHESTQGCHNYHWLMAEMTEIYCLTVLETRNPISRCQHGQSLMKSLSLGCRQPPSHLTTHGWWGDRSPVYVLMRTLIPTQGLYPHVSLVTPQSPHPISKYHQIGGDASAYKLRRGEHNSVFSTASYILRITVIPSLGWTWRFKYQRLSMWFKEKELFLPFPYSHP